MTADGAKTPRGHARATAAPRKLAPSGAGGLPRTVAPSPATAPIRPKPAPGARPLGGAPAPPRTASRKAAAIEVPAVLDRAVADRQLVVGATALILLARLLDGPPVWLVSLLIGAGVLIGTGWSRGSADINWSAATFRARWESVVGGAAGIESGIVPAVLAASLALAIRIVPLDWQLALAGVVVFVGIDRSVALERDHALSADHDQDRWKALLAVLTAAFVGFVGIASMVAGGLAPVAGDGLGGALSTGLAEPDLLALAAGDAVIAGLLGFRLARLGPAARREAAISGAGFGAVVAIGAGLLRAMAIPQLLGPALLTVLVYLWDALNATTPSIRRDPRWRWQLGLLAVLAAVVIGWNLRLRA